jgi:hypothetical protein
MPIPRKPYLTPRDYARHMFQEAALAESRADLLGRASQDVERAGDTVQADAMRHTCRKLRVQALFDRCRAVAAEVKAGKEP